MAATAHATSFTFKPDDGSGNLADLHDLEHSYAYTWGITPSTQLMNELKNGYTITSAKLTITNIWDWKRETDILYIHSLNGPSNGVRSILDNPNDIVSNGNYFDLNNPSRYSNEHALTTWSDPYGGYARNFNLVYQFTDVDLAYLNSWVKDGGTFGLGFDPECHYYNDGIKFEIKTTPTPSIPPPKVPDGGSTLFLLSMTATGMAWLPRKIS